MQSAVRPMEKATVSASVKMGIIRSINGVQRDLYASGGIGKNQQNQQQRYAFRGIDDVMNSLSPALVKNGLVILPEVLERTVSEKAARNGGCLFYVTLKVRYTLICAEDGSEMSVVVYGEAMDSGDKATNKALSAAYKYMALQTFCIATEGDNDADLTTHHPQYQQATPIQQTAQQNAQVYQEMADNIVSNINQKRREEAERKAEYLRANPPKSYPKYEEPKVSYPKSMECGPTGEFYDDVPSRLLRDQLQVITNELEKSGIDPAALCRVAGVNNINLILKDDFQRCLEWLRKTALKKMQATQ